MKDIIQYNGYCATVHFSAEDNLFYGKVSGITDLVLVEGKSITELELAFEEAVKDYLETLKELA